MAAIGPGFTVRLPVAVFPETVAMTVWAPQWVAVQDPLVQVPSGAMLKALDGVTSPRSLPYRSKPSTAYDGLAPATTAAGARLSAGWSRDAAGRGSTARP